MRASRLLSMLILLQVRGRVSARELAAEFEVSVRTIYRDVDELSAAGVPVYAERGRAGGFALHAGYRTRLTGLTQEEAGAVLLAGVGGAAADLGVGAAAAAAQLKLLASLPADASATARRVASCFHLDPVAWYGRPEALAALPALARATWMGTRLRIEYDSWRGAVTRDVEPLGLVLKGGLWYLVAGDDGEPRTYRVAGIRSSHPLPGTVRRPARFDLARWWAGASGEFESRLLRERARVRLSAAGLRLLRDQQPAASAAAVAVPGGAARRGWVEMRIPVEALPEATRAMLRLGGEVEVLEPAELRAAVAAMAGRIARRHRRPAPLSPARTAPRRCR